MRITGVFFHEIFSLEPGPIISNKFQDFPKVMEKELKLPNVKLFKPQPVSEDILQKIHSQEYLEKVKMSWFYKRARISIGGAILASEKIWTGEIHNALVFNSAAGHHAGKNFGWGGTYLSIEGPLITFMREKYGVEKFAILDTDAHHGDGTREIIGSDPNILHMCFCDRDYINEDGTKIDIDVTWLTEHEYLALIKEEFVIRFKKFKPNILLHYLGHDICEGDYASLGYSKDFFLKLCEIIKDAADKICGYIIITHGGARKDVAEYIFPRIIRILSR